MSARFTRILGLSATALVLIPNVAISDMDMPRSTCFLWPNGVPLSDDEPIVPEALTFFVIHGFRDSGVSVPSLCQTNAIQRRFPEANVIIVDWRPVTESLEEGGCRQKQTGLFGFGWLLTLPQKYDDWAETTKSVGRDIAEWIKQKGILPHRTVISGHSLGAQIAASASNECARSEMCGEPVHTIIAADPAGPNFESCPPEQRLDPTDAQHVIVVHTTEFFGDEHLIGTLDIQVDWLEPKQPDPIKRHSFAREFITMLFLGTDTSTTDQTALDADVVSLATLRIDGTDVDFTDGIPSSPLNEEPGNADDVVAYVLHAANSAANQALSHDREEEEIPDP